MPVVILRSAILRRRQITASQFFDKLCEASASIAWG